MAEGRRAGFRELIVCFGVVLAFAAGVWFAVGRTGNSSGRSREYTGSWAQVADILARVKVPSFAERDFNIKDYGAVGDGQTDCKKAIDKAILACCYADGGRVVVPAGTYKINGPIHLQSDVNLHLEEGSRIVFGTNYEDYMPVALTRWSGVSIYNYSPMVYVYRKKNVAITGSGELDGQAHDTWCAWSGRGGDDAKEVRRMNEEDVPVVDRVFGSGHYIRPSMVQFYGCENVLVDGIKIADAPAWCVHPVFSKNVTIRNITFAAKNPNNDGIDVDSCEYVHIHDVVFDNADDCIALKSGRGREGREMGLPTRNVYIHDCVFNAYTGIAVGSEMSGGVYNIFAEDCEAKSQVKRAFYIKGNRNRGGEAAHIRYRNMKFLDSREEMLAISTNYSSASGESQDFPPSFRDIRWENITAEGPCATALRIEGQADMPVEDVVLKNVTVRKAAKNKQTAHVRNLVMQNVVLGGELRGPDAGNLPPDVYAGPEQVVDANDDMVATLEGHVADDGKGGGKLTYQWSSVGSDGVAMKFDDPQALWTKASFSKPGMYVLRLTADDGELKGSHTVAIEVYDRPDAGKEVQK